MINLSPIYPVTINRIPDKSMEKVLQFTSYQQVCTKSLETTAGGLENVDNL